MRAVLRSVVVLAALAVSMTALAQPADAPSARSIKIPAPLTLDVAFARQIAFIRADLLIANALVNERDWVDAARHADFPREEVYGVIRADLRTYKTPQFDTGLRALSHAIRARSIKQYRRALDKVEAALAKADAALKARQPDWPQFVLQVAAATLPRAGEEYDDAVADGRIVHPVGYQTARGVVFQVAQMIDIVAEPLAARDAEALQDLRGTLVQLKSAFAPLAAPKQAPMEPATVESLIGKAGAAARRL